MNKKKELLNKLYNMLELAQSLIEARMDDLIKNTYENDFNLALLLLIELEVKYLLMGHGK